MSEDSRIIYSSRVGFSTTTQETIHYVQPDPFEECWDCPENFGKGQFRRFRIHNGFDIWITDCQFYRETPFTFSDNPSTLIFGFCLSGYSSTVVPDKKSPVEISARHQSCVYVNDPDGYCRVRPQDPILHISVMIKPAVLKCYFESDLEQVPTMIRDVVLQRRARSFSVLNTITPQMDMALYQILHCPYRGAVRKLFYESRALELIAYQLQTLSSSGPSTVSMVMHPMDRERTEYARHLLVQDLENPPTLESLARSVGMSHPKLNRCFRQMFGKTVFQLLKQERLNQARQMLEYQNLSVTEAALSTGYNSISHFSQLYKRQFGISPGVYAKSA